MYGLDPSIALGSTSDYRFLWRDPRYSRLCFPGATSPVCLGFPNEPLRQHAVRLDPSCALSHRESTFFHIWFLKTKYFNILRLPPTFLELVRERRFRLGKSGYLILRYRTPFEYAGKRTISIIES